MRLFGHLSWIHYWILTSISSWSQELPVLYVSLFWNWLDCFPHSILFKITTFDDVDHVERITLAVDSLVSLISLFWKQHRKLVYLMASPMTQEWYVQKEINLLLTSFPLYLLKHPLIFFSLYHSKVAFFVAMDCCCTRYIINESEFSEWIARRKCFNFYKPLKFIKFRKVFKFSHVIIFKF